MLDSRAREQFRLICTSYFREPFPQSFSEILDSNPDFVTSWIKRFDEQLHLSRQGYPLGPVYKEPVLEDQLLNFISKSSMGLEEREAKATLVLSHDVDYLKFTLPLFLKTLIGRKKLLLPGHGKQFLRSVRDILDFERSVIGRNQGTSTFFLAAPFKSRKLQQRFWQYVIDPSYVGSPEWEALLEILKEFKPDIGVHGSFYSITEGRLREEIDTLEVAVGRKIISSRQHWLNLPGKNPFDVIAGSGILIDSTLGWNGSLGFRGGLCRDFALATQHGTVRCIPMALMDGVLFDEMKLSAKQAERQCLEILQMVKKRKGTVAINWHERSFSEVYGWGDVYKSLIFAAKQLGFSIKNINETVH